MLPHEFLRLEKCTDNHFKLKVEARISTAGNFLYGGSALAASIEAAETQTGNPIIWISNQYLTYSSPGDELDLKISYGAVGNSITQLQLQGSVEDRVVFIAQGGFGSKKEGASYGFKQSPMPCVRPPEDSSAYSMYENKLIAQDHIYQHIELRKTHPINKETSPTQMLLWARIPDYCSSNASYLALVGDCIPGTMLTILNRLSAGISLDNSLRVIKPVVSDWVLLEVNVDGIFNGIGHASCNIWSQNGELSAVATQSFVITTYD